MHVYSIEVYSYEKLSNTVFTEVKEMTANQTIFDAQYIQLHGAELWTIEILLWAGFPSRQSKNILVHYSCGCK